MWKQSFLYSVGEQLSLSGCPADHTALSENAEQWERLALGVVNVAVSTVMVDAWSRGQKVTIHGWAFGVHDGLLQDLHMNVSSTDAIEPLYRAAIEGVIEARK